MATSPLVDERLALIYAESVRGLDQQERTIDGFRSRAGTVVAAAALATAFLGGQALKNRSLHGLAWAGVGTFVATVVLSLAVLLPWRWVLVNSATSLIDQYVEGKEPQTLSELQRDVALWNEINYDRNERWLRAYAAVFTAACIFLVAEVVIWLVVVARR